MTNFNLTIIEGRLTRDCELKYTAKGNAMLLFSIANNFYKINDGKKEQKVTFFDVIAWDSLAEIMANYLKKGKRIIVSGRLILEKYKTKSGEEKVHAKVIANNIDFVSNNENNFKKTLTKTVA